MSDVLLKPGYAWTSELEEMALCALGRCTFAVASFDKRFVNGLHGARQLTQKQRDLLWRMVHRYRRQIRDRGLLQIAEEIVRRMNLPKGVRV